MVFLFVYFVLHAHAFHVCVCEQFFCMVWLNPPTEEGLSPKNLVYQNKFDTFQSILSIIYNFRQCHASYEFFDHSYWSRLTGWLTDLLNHDRPPDWPMTDFVTDWLTLYWLIDWLMDSWPTDALINSWLTDGLTDWLIYWLITDHLIGSLLIDGLMTNWLTNW